MIVQQSSEGRKAMTVRPPIVASLYITTVDIIPKMCLEFLLQLDIVAGVNFRNRSRVATWIIR
eukprot:6157848-Pyramimonas_sp.AAC.1